MKTYSVNEIAKLSGKDRRTIGKRLEHANPDPDGRFTLAAVLDAFERHGGGNAATLDLAQERAQLAREQRLKLERERRQDEGSIAGSVPLQVCHDASKSLGEGLAIAAKQSLYAAAPRLAEATDPHVVAEIGYEATYNSIAAAVSAQLDRWPKPFAQGVLDGLAAHTSESRDRLEKRIREYPDQ